MSKKETNPFASTSQVSLSQKRELHWEESVIDTVSDVEGFTSGVRNTASLWTLYGIAFILVCLLVSRLFVLQGVRGAQMREIAEGNRIRKQILLAPRGFIVDSKGKQLAQNTVSFNLVAIPSDLQKEGLDEEVTQLTKLFGLDKNALEEVLSKVDRRSFDPIVIKSGLSEEDAILFATKSGEFTGFQVQSVPIRQYVSPEVFSHILGYTSIISEDEYRDRKHLGYYHADYIGKSGIEVIYEPLLRGKNGEDLVEVDAAGRLRQSLGKIDPQPGNVAHLNIDKELQEFATGAFQKAKGAVVVMEPKTGKILALVSVPSFDNNLFAKGISSSDYQKLLQDKNLPLFNRAIQGQYPPGSTVKPMVALAGLEEGSITDKTIIVDRGRLVIPNQFNPAIAYNFNGWNLAGLGALDVYQAVAKSSDIYFYTLGGGHPDSPHIKNPLGANRLASWYRKFLLGKPLGIDLPGEKGGVVADPAWKADYFKKDAVMSKWYLGDTYHISIGQGDMLVTPLQVAEWTAIIANGGKGYRPHILATITDQSGKVIFENKPEQLVGSFAKDENWKIAQKSMRDTVLFGSAQQLLSLPITSAGKTGTSQFDGSDPSRTHAWFTSYAPYEDPQIVVTVLVEAGGEGHAEAEPIAKQILQWWSEHRYNK